jgi:hypothetical protein
MVSRKKKIQAAYGDWKIVTDGTGKITECYGVFSGDNAGNHADQTATYINFHYARGDNQSGEYYRPQVVSKCSDDFRCHEVEVPLRHAKSFVEWLKEHGINVTEEKDGEKLWINRLRPGKGHPQQGFFSDPTDPPRRR